ASWMSFGRIINTIINSPAMRELLHSSEERHFDKNSALDFSIWDCLTGTLYVPSEKEEFKLRLSNREHLAYDSVTSLYLTPIKKAAALIGRWRATPSENVSKL